MKNLRIATLIFLLILFCFGTQIIGLASDTPEITFYQGVPLSPNIQPVIYISGSDYEMGYQWYQQLIQVFGPWILTTNQIGSEFFWQGHDFSEEELVALKAHQMYIKQYAPEWINIFKGMADGATDAGIPLTYTEVLAQWTAAEVFPSPPPESAQEVLPPEDHCSGFAAWGSATRDGKTICGISVDDSGQFDITIVALPKEGGNNFIFTPFHPAGGQSPPWRPKLGSPALNDKGLVFVRECDVTSVTEEEWTYGLPAGISDLHTIRFANNAQEALDMILSWPSSDGLAAGFWADISGDSWTIESREEPEVIRRAGDIGEEDFLFFTNNALSPLASEFAGGGTMYVKHGGWSGPGTRGFSSVSRNLQLWNMLNYYQGNVNLEFAKMMYRFSGDPHPGSPVLDLSLGSATADDYSVFETADLKKNIGGLHNANVYAILPEAQEYYVCKGHPGREAYPPVNRGFYYTDALHTFFQLKLAPSIPEITKAAQTQASYELIRADRELTKLTYLDPAFAPLKEIFNKAATERRKGEYYRSLARATEGNDAVYNWGKALRGFTSSQAYAQAVYEALVPPPATPEDLLLKPWGYWVNTIR